MCLFRVCAKHEYYSLCFCEMNIIDFKKSNKNNYIDIKIYKFITLLNIINKTLESIIARKINTLAKKHNMLLDTQINKRRKQACETTFELLTKQIHTI